MPKQTKLADDVRRIVSKINAIRSERGLVPRWSQAENVYAVALLAEDWREGNLANPDMPRKDFMALGEYGLFGNASQFRQALENLPDADPLKLAKGSENTSGYE